MKKFWKRTEGFTLVELVVVIAILGILAGVGTVGYSGYVKKANMAADQQLASQVANALQLHYYANPTTATSGYVILTENGAVGDGTGSIDAAMTASFGDNWDTAGNDSMSLKYNGWSSAVTSANVAAIDGSNFAQNNLRSMLDSVSSLTNVLSGFLDDGIITIDDLNSFATANGIDPTTASGQELANMMPMVIAQNLTNKLADKTPIPGAGTTYQDEFILAYKNTLFEGGALADELQNDNVINMDMYTAYAVEYAQVEGMLNYLANNGSATEKAKGQELLNKWKSDTANLQNRYNGSGTTMVRNLLTEAKTSIFSASEFSEETLFGYETNCAEQDALAFTGYMEGLTHVSSSLLANPESLKNSTYYKDSTISDTVLNYLGASKTLAAKGIRGSAIMVMVDSNGNAKSLVSNGQ